MAKKKPATPKYDAFKHPEATSPMRPDVGTQPEFKKKKPPVTYRYDSSLSPASTGTGRTRRGRRARLILAELAERLAGPSPGPRIRERNADLRGRLSKSIPVLRADREAQGHVAAVPQLGGQGRAALVRRADAPPVRPRAALDQGDHRDPRRPQAPSSAGHDSTSSAIPHHSIADQVTPGLRVPGRLGQPDDPRRFARRDELAARTTRTSAARSR